MLRAACCIANARTFRWGGDRGATKAPRGGEGFTRRGSSGTRAARWHSSTKGATPVLSPAEAKEAPRTHRHELPGRAPRPGAPQRHALQLRAGERGPGDAAGGLYFLQGSRGWLRLHEKGRESAAEALDDYLAAAELEEPKVALFQSVGPGGVPADGAGAAAAGRPGDDQASGGGRGAAVVDDAQQIAGHASPKTMKLYDRTADTVTVDEIERIVI